MAEVPRIGMMPIDEAKAVARSLGIAEQMGELSVFRILLRHPALAKALSGLLMMLLFEGNKLDGRLRELIIMRIGWVTGSEYEWTQHWRVSRQMEIPEAHLVAVRDWRNADCFDAADQAVLAATDETLRDGTIGDTTWSQCKEHVGGPEELMEMVAAIGNWRTFSQLLRSIKVPLEEGVTGWPPDGRKPTSAE